MKPNLPAELAGLVRRFKGNGRQLGYPTANLKIQTELPDGVYFGFADLAKYKHHPAIIFIGTPTTVGDTDRRVEAYLLDIPDQDYYDLSLKLSLEHYHRPNQTFNNIDQLKEAIKQDMDISRQWFPSGN